MRLVLLNFEVTGLELNADHRIIEVACVELVDRRLTGRTIHRYLNPEREVDPEMEKVHGLTSSFLADKPIFSDLADELVEFIRSAELVVHSAQFTLGFLDNELRRASFPMVDVVCNGVVDTLQLAKLRHPGAKNSLSALCARYGIDLAQPSDFGALFDATALAHVYLEMTRRSAH